MAGSAAEREIRDAVVARIRTAKPSARVIHELVVGSCRADLAAVEPERVTLFEIKSSRDKLDRLERQVKHFSAAAHETIVVADVRWFKPYDNRPGYCRGVELERLGYGDFGLWRFPEPTDPAEHGLDRWRFNRWPSLAQPHAAKLIGLLWRAEMLEEAFIHRIAAGSRSTMSYLAEQMAWHMTGAEIARAVCRQLRKRHFPEADAPIVEARAAA